MAALKDQEKRFILKGFYDDFETISIYEKLPASAKDLIGRLDTKEVTFHILGNWALLMETRELISMDKVAYPN